ncbi:MAG: C25 family cysteine peptidase [Anaerolineae bacterium]
MKTKDLFTLSLLVTLLVVMILTSSCFSSTQVRRRSDIPGQPPTTVEVEVSRPGQSTTSDASPSGPVPIAPSEGPEPPVMAGQPDERSPEQPSEPPLKGPTGYLVEYRRGGGFFGYCDYLTIRANGKATYQDECRDRQAETELDADRLRVLLDLAATLKSFSRVDEPPPAAKDALATGIWFYGNGEQAAAETDIETISSMVTELTDLLRQEASSSGSSEQVQPPSPSSSSLSKEASSSSLVALFVDDATYTALEEQVQQYQGDIERDLQARVILFVQKFREPDEVRAKLLELRRQGLIGAVLIGDIPTTYVRARLNSPDLMLVPTDFYYMDLDDNFALDSNGVFDPPIKTLSLLPEIWVGRLKPPETEGKGYALLREYFERNHAYRTGQIKSPRKILIFDPIGLEGVPGQERERYLADADRLVERIGLYYPSDATLLFNSGMRVDVQSYLGKLQEDFELAYFNLHGTSTTQQIGTEIISSEIIQKVRPQPYFYFIWSCSNGDFTKKNYVAGAYLFHGNGLVVLASTVPVFGNLESGTSALFPLSLGATFGEAYQYANFLSSMTLLGDPTLRIRKKPEAAPILRLSARELDFGEISVLDSGAIGAEGYRGSELRINVRNEGAAPLQISPVPSFSYYLRNGLPPSGGDIRPIMFSFPNRVEPHSSKELIFNFIPSEQGKYEGFLAFYTNDPDNIFVVIAYRGERS